MAKKYNLIILMYIFLNFSVFSADSGNISLIKALDYEKSGDMLNAVKYYEQYLIHNKNDIIFLKIVRLTENYEIAVLKYRQFLKEYNTSKFINLARYELANLMLLNGFHEDSLNEFIILRNNNHNNQYFSVSYLNIIKILYNTGKYDIALDEISELLKITQNNEIKANCYYLLGKIKYKLNSIRESEKNFIICIKNYPDSSFVSNSLFELFMINIHLERIDNSLKYAYLLKKYFNLTFEYHAVALFMDNKKLVIPNNNDFNEYNFTEAKSENNDNSIILKEMENSFNNIYHNELLFDDINKSIYIQLAYLGSEENAVMMLEKYIKDGLSEVFIAKSKSSKSGKVGFRLLLGPYMSKDEADKKTVVLNKMNISSVIMELVKNYE